MREVACYRILNRRGRTRDNASTPQAYTSQEFVNDGYFARGLPGLGGGGEWGGVPLRVDGDLRARVSRLGRETAPGYRFHGGGERGRDETRIISRLAFH